MGREIRRVPLDFNWELNKIWEGFLCPYSDYSETCDCCKGSGFNHETQQISDHYYDSEGFNSRWHYEYEQGKAVRVIGNSYRWKDKITLDELQALFDAGRFSNLTSDWVEGEGWVKKVPEVIATQEVLDEVNLDNGTPSRGFGHDGINRCILIETRAKRLGVYGTCEKCKGEGSFVIYPEMAKLAEEWESTGPPVGEGWQVWETVSEGSPITPVFATAEALVNYLVNVGAWGRKYSWKAAEAFVKDDGWVPSAIIVNNEFKRDIEAAPCLASNKPEVAVNTLPYYLL